MGSQAAGRLIDGRGELRIGQLPDRAVLTLPGERAAIGVARGARLDGCPGVVERAAAPPTRPRRTARRRRGSGVGRRSQAIPMSSAAAPQNQPGSAAARAWRASSDGSPVVRRNRASRALGAARRSGRQATSSLSRPKIGQSCVTATAYGVAATAVPASIGRSDHACGDRRTRCSRLEGRRCDLGSDRCRPVVARYRLRFPALGNPGRVPVPSSRPSPTPSDGPVLIGGRRRPEPVGRRGAYGETSAVRARRHLR